MRTELFDYALPEQSIAVRPLPERDAARLLTLDGATLSHGAMSEWPDRVPPGALVVVNDTRVVPARIRIERPRGEVLLV